ncbi:MAG TPA: hypothetical protein VJN22_06055, partial [Candidatus Eremiobacteraceae bacterium]|nr:hypothetical protein [Candidatus Eremiobacteraceae bacterium]
IRVPTAVIHGSRDPIVSAAEAGALASAIDGATYTEIDGAGHVPTFEHPGSVTAALTELLARSA